MLKKRRFFAIVAIIGTMIISEDAMSHTTVMSKNTPDGYNTRDEREGTTSLNHFSIPHGCDGRAIRAQSVVFPNSADAIAEDSDTGASVDLADHIIGNPVMGAKPAVNSLFDKVKKVEGPVPAFVSHGREKTEDTRSFAFTKGKLEDGYLGLTPWRATFPKFKPNSCATALTVYIAIANYCTKSRDEYDDDRADIWIGRLTEKFDDSDVVSLGWWPYLRVVRDLGNNPISCGEGFEIDVYPSDKAIDEFLPIAGYWPAEGKCYEDDDSEDNGHRGRNKH